MIGRNHATIGAVAALGITPLLEPDPTIVALTAITAAGAAVLPDLDHPKATVSRVFPIIGPAIACTVAALSGGHRNRTHTLEIAAATTIATILATASRPATAIIAGILVCFAAALLGPHLNLVPTTSLAEFIIGAAVGAAIWHYTWIPLWWLPLAVGIGYLAHLAADALTISGIKPLMLAPKIKLRLARLRTGGPAEAIVGGFAVAAFMVLGWINVVAPLVNDYTTATP